MNPLHQISLLLGRRSRMVASYQDAVAQREKANDERDQALDQVRRLRTELRSLRDSHVTLAGKLITAEDERRGDLRLLAEHTRTIQEMSTLIMHQRSGSLGIHHDMRGRVEADTIRHLLDKHINRRGDTA